MDESLKNVCIGLVSLAFAQFSNKIKEVSKFITSQLKSVFNYPFNCFVLNPNFQGFSYQKITGYNITMDYKNKKIIIFSEGDKTKLTKEEIDKKLENSEDSETNEEVKELSCDMVDEIKEKVKKIIFDSSKTSEGNISYFIELIQKNLENKLGGSWNVLTFAYKDYTYNVHYEKGFSMVLKLKSHIIFIYKNNNDKIANRSENTIANVILCKMKEEMKNFIVYSCVGLIESNPDKKKAAEEIVNAIQNKYGNYWQCFVIDKNGNGGMKVQYKKEKYLSFEYKGFTYIIFQSA